MAALTDRPINPGVGMPAALHLNAWGHELYRAFGHHPYLVGSALYGKQWRDIDVRLMLPDDEFDALFPDHYSVDQADPRWALMCAALAEYGRARTGLPIDFQIQHRGLANAEFNGPRSALGIYVRPEREPARDMFVVGSSQRREA